ncbi:MAG: hypothetical protein ACYDC2_02815, partial [Solirubrobacteraceae bacterium]
MSLSRLLGVVWACSVLLGFLPSSAGASGVTALEREHMSDIAQWVYRVGAAENSAGCGELCERMWAAQSALPRNVPLLFWNELGRLMLKSTGGLWGVPTQRRVSLTATPSRAGWYIGGHNAKWMWLPVPAGPGHDGCAEITHAHFSYYENWSPEGRPPYGEAKRSGLDWIAEGCSSDMVAQWTQQQPEATDHCNNPLQPQSIAQGAWSEESWWWNTCKTNKKTGGGEVSENMFAEGLYAPLQFAGPGPVEPTESPIISYATEPALGMSELETRLEAGLVERP